MVPIPMTTNVLIGEGDGDLRQAMCRFLRSRGYRVRSTSDGRRVLRMVRREDAQVAIVDLSMRGLSGDRLLAANAGRPHPLPVIAVTPEAEIFQAVAAVKGGVYEYLTKPFEMDHMELLVQRASAGPGPAETTQRILLDAPAGTAHARPLFGFSRTMQAVFRAVRTAAQSSVPVLLIGELGTGREMVARVLHHASTRREGPFVSVHAGAVSRADLGARLFGSLHAERPGCAVDAAHGGTLFVDDVDRLPQDVQQRLVRALKTGDLGRRRGSDQPLPERLDARLVATATTDLTRQLGEGSIRPDLYWYLRALTVRVPPLRERREDILPLARWLLARHASALDQPQRILAPGALHWLQDHHWPGNVRELESVLVRGLTLSRSAVIARDDLVGPSRRLDEGVAGAPDQSFEDLLMNRLRPVVKAFSPGPEGSDLYQLVIESAEKAVITLALQRVGGNRSAAARLLGINRNTLRTKIEHLHVPTRLPRRGRS